MNVQEEDTLEYISIENIFINPNQPRKTFGIEELEDLAQSIKEVGIIHPPLVRRLPIENHFELISGERRLRAAKLAGMDSIPVIITTNNSCLSAQQALIENVQRVDLNPIEISKALKGLSEKFGYTQEELAQKIGKKRSTVTNYLRLLALPKPIQESLCTLKISMGHAKAILSLNDFDQQIWLFERILRDDLSVREAEKAAQKIENKSKKKNLSYETRDFYLEELAKKVQEKLGTKVNILGKGKKGRIFIDYYNYDDLDRLLNLIGIHGKDS